MPAISGDKQLYYAIEQWCWLEAVKYCHKELSFIYAVGLLDLPLARKA